MKETIRQLRHPDVVKVYLRPAFKLALKQAAEFHETNVTNYLRMAAKAALRRDGFTITKTEQRTS